MAPYRDGAKAILKGVTPLTLDEALRHKEMRVKALEASLAATVERLRTLGAIKVTLFGSLTRGEVDLGSDLDLLVVMPANSSGREWSRRLSAEIPRGVAMDLLIYGEDEWKGELPRHSFLRHIQEQGRVGYQKGVH